MGKLLTSVAATALAVVIALSSGLALLTGGLTSTCATDLSPTSSATTGTTSRATSSTPGWDAAQLANATTIVTVGARLGVPARGQAIALATAIQESSLRNLAGGDRDSVGLFQQRPSAGWGTATQIRDPSYATERFYRALLAVPGWQSMPLPQAAQSVQRSAFPLAYTDDEAPAAALFASLTGAAPPGAVCGQLDDTAGSATLPAEFTPPAATSGRVAQALSWALLQVGTPYSYGGDCTAAHSGRAVSECDCSSLTQQAFLRAGIHLPRTAAAQSREGLPVALTALQPGDLLFSVGADGTPAEPGHVALALGSGWIIEAPRTGLTVRVVRITPARAASVVSIRRVAARK